MLMLRCGLNEHSRWCTGFSRPLLYRLQPAVGVPASAGRWCTGFSRPLVYRLQPAKAGTPTGHESIANVNF